MDPAPRSFRVSLEESGQRLDLLLAEHLALSRSQARRLLGRGAVSVDGAIQGTEAKGRSLGSGATVDVAPFQAPGSEHAQPEADAALRLLASGPGWLAVDKPAGTPVHPYEPEETGSVLGALLARHPEMQGVGEDGLRSGVVHRLDVDTSGVLLFATEQACWQRLRQAFRDRLVEKVYRAVVSGSLEEAGTLRAGLVVARHRPAKVRVLRHEERDRARGAREVVIDWRPLEWFGEATLVEVRPATGFLHQIRAVFAHLGHPLVGDTTYAPAVVAAAAPRHLLHASELRFAEVAAESPDPEDFAGWLARARVPEPVEDES